MSRRKTTKNQRMPKRTMSEKKRASKPSSSPRSKVTFPHFRYYKKNKHPALIVGEQKNDKKVEEWKFRKVMHSERDGRHLNEKVYPNPDPTDSKPMYIGKRERHDVKSNFSSWTYSWKYNKKKKK